MATTAPVIDVIDPSGKSHRVNGRAAAMVVLLLAYQERINASRGGYFKLNYDAGTKIKPDIFDQLEGN